VAYRRIAARKLLRPDEGASSIIPRLLFLNDDRSWLTPQYQLGCDSCAISFRNKRIVTASYYLQRASEAAACRYGVDRTLSDWRGGSSGWVALR
jgi:hypothetical protein